MHAFTVGSDIAFARGAHRPGTLTGDALIAHELAHVVQQASAGGPSAASDSHQGLPQGREGRGNGKQLWSGFGATGLTEREMNEELMTNFKSLGR